MKDNLSKIANLEVQHMAGCAQTSHTCTTHTFSLAMPASWAELTDVTYTHTHMHKSLTNHRLLSSAA